MFNSSISASATVKITKQQGLTLVEILVAIAISLFIIAFIVRIFQTQIELLKQTIALHEIQMNLNLSAEMLTFDLKNAGFLGCSRIKPNDHSFSLPDIFPFDAQYAIHLFDPVNKNQQGVLIEYADHETPIKLLQSNQIQTIKQAYFKTNDWLIVSNCMSYDFNKIKKIKNTGNYEIITLNENITTSDSDFLEILQPHEYVYQVEKSTRKNNQNDDIDILTRKDLLASAHEPDETAEGISGLRFKFISHYSKNGSLLSVYFLVSSVDSIKNNIKEVYFFDHSFYPEDKRFYRAYRFNVYMRDITS